MKTPIVCAALVAVVACAPPQSAAPPKNVMVVGWPAIVTVTSSLATFSNAALRL